MNTQTFSTLLSRQLESLGTGSIKVQHHPNQGYTISTEDLINEHRATIKYTKTTNDYRIGKVSHYIVSVCAKGSIHNLPSSSDFDTYRHTATLIYQLWFN